MTKKIFFVFIIKILFLLFVFSSYAEKNLIIYTYSSFSSPWGPGQKIKKSFEKIYNCKVHFISMHNSISILNRLKIEGKQSKADIVIGLDSNLIKEAEKTKLFKEHNIDLSKLKLPKLWSNKTFIPYDYSYFSFIYNSKKITNPPKSFKELLLNNDNWNIIYEDPRSSTLGIGLVLWMKKIFNNNTNDFFKKLSKKTVTITHGWTQAYNLFLNGESDFLFSYTTSILNFINQKQNFYKTLYFSEGHYIQTEIAGQLLHSKNYELANKFMKFILSEKCQYYILKQNLMYPVINIQLPSEFNELLIPNNTLEYNTKEIDLNLKKWINEWENITQ